MTTGGRVRRTAVTAAATVALLGGAVALSRPADTGAAGSLPTVEGGWSPSYSADEIADVLETIDAFQNGDPVATIDLSPASGPGFITCGDSQDSPKYYIVKDGEVEAGSAEFGSFSYEPSDAGTFESDLEITDVGTTAGYVLCQPGVQAADVDPAIVSKVIESVTAGEVSSDLSVSIDGMWGEQQILVWDPTSRRQVTADLAGAELPMDDYGQGPVDPKVAIADLVDAVDGAPLVELCLTAMDGAVSAIAADPADPTIGTMWIHDGEPWEAQEMPAPSGPALDPATVDLSALFERATTYAAEASPRSLSADSVCVDTAASGPSPIVSYTYTDAAGAGYLVTTDLAGTVLSSSP